MSKGYIIAIDQSTSGTKAMIFNDSGKILGRHDLPHKQIISDEGYVSHDPIEIYDNLIKCVSIVIDETGINKNEIQAVGISNQRETALVWNKNTGTPAADAVVWHCSRAQTLCDELSEYEKTVKELTGLQLSPYFSAAKISYILKENCKKPYSDLYAGTIDSWLIYKLTNKECFYTDFSNAARTQLFNINTLTWDEKLCHIFDVPMSMLPKVTDSDSVFGYTDFEGVLPEKIPIHCVLGDSNGALYGQGCYEAGSVKATYGTGSSVMMNIGNTPIYSDNGLSSSIAWKIDGKVNYVLEGNINYTGSVIKWLVDDLKLISSSKESGELALKANKNDKTYLVPAFTGLGAPYYDSSARCIICGISRTTGKNEIVRAAENCIAYQINDIIELMQETGVTITGLHVDGGPTRDKYLMQFQSDIIDKDVLVPSSEELSAIGVAYLCGIASGVYNSRVFENIKYLKYSPSITKQVGTELKNGWKNAVSKAMN